jgi:hypothetical protein
MDSDDQLNTNNNNNNTICENNDDPIEYKVNITDKIDGSGSIADQLYDIANDQYLDGNGNRLNDKNRIENNENEKTLDCSCIEISSSTSRASNRTNNDNHIDDKIMRKLQAMSISDDDYGK